MPKKLVEDTKKLSADLEAKKAKVTDPKIKAAIDEKIKALNTTINK